MPEKIDERADALAAGVRRGERKALARAITLCESTKRADSAVAAGLLERLGVVAHGGTVRVGISGAAGVGKSSFIEALGLLAAKKGRKVAVLAVDPQSKRGGGAILGDKTRMPLLSGSADAFIRPSAGGDGGVHPATGAAVVCCEAAGYDLVIVETIGSGQSETKVRELVDMFWLLVGPGGGDEVQAIKRGAMELADLVIVTKCDGELAAQARLTAAGYSQGLSLMRRNWRNWQAKAVTTSAHAGFNLEKIWRHLEEFLRDNREQLAAARR